MRTTPENSLTYTSIHMEPKFYSLYPPSHNLFECWSKKKKNLLHFRNNGISRKPEPILKNRGHHWIQRTRIMLKRQVPSLSRKKSVNFMHSVINIFQFWMLIKFFFYFLTKPLYIFKQNLFIRTLIEFRKIIIVCFTILSV